jgi:hypothetical protein
MTAKWSWTYPKISTSVSCSISSSEITEGSSVTASGSISPVVPGVTVTLTYKKPDSTKITRTVTTGSDGSYSSSYSPDAVGSWSVTASWNGDSLHEGASSLSKTFIVKEKPFIETPTGMVAISCGLIGTVIVMAAVILKRNKGVSFCPSEKT